MKSDSIRILKTIALAVSLGLSVAGAANATKLSAPPLPRERDAKNFDQGQTSVIQQTSRFQRRPDYREADALKKKEEEDAQRKSQETRLQAIEDAKRAQTEQVENIKKRQQTAVEHNSKAVAFGKQGRWVEAIEQHEEAVKLDPSNKQLRINLSAARTAFGQSRLAAGDLSTATAMFRKALAAASDNGLAGRLLSESMQRQGRNPGSADVRLATGDQLAAVGDYESAAVEYQAAMQLEGSARCHVKMGDMALRFGQLSTAINWYRQAIVKDPEHGDAHRQLGAIALATKDYTGAASSLRKAVICNPKDVAAGQMLSEIWRRQVAANPLLAENHLGLAGALQLTGDFAGADSEYRKLETLDPKNPGLEAGRQSLGRAIQHAKADKHRLAAETLFNQGLKREALAEISQAVMMEPRNGKYQFLLGECLEANGDFQGAHRAYLTCVLIDPENNKEAAARMKEMQGGNKVRSMTPAQVNQIGNQLAGQYNRPPQIAQPMQSPPMQTQGMQQVMQAPQVMQGQQVMQSQPMQQASAPTKDMFEGIPGGQSQSGINPAVGFRTHDERDVAPAPQAVQPAAQVQQRKVIAAANPSIGPAIPPRAQTTPATPAKPAEAAVSPALAEALSRIEAAEAQRDFASAVAILRQLLITNLQNADVHHRLAVDLLNNGQITEAIAEFRIASALAPSKKAFSDDLARAMVIHKRSLMSDAGTNSTGDNTGDSAGANEQ